MARKICNECNRPVFSKGLCIYHAKIRDRKKAETEIKKKNTSYFCKNEN